MVFSSFPDYSGSMRRFNDYNLIAPIYDLLGLVVYGGALHRSQLHFLSQLPKDQRILIIGGGTGRLIKPVLEICSPKEVIYVEKSGKMIDLSRKRLKSLQNHPVRFIHGTQDDLPEAQRFDVVITPFFFDQFTYYRLARIFIQLNRHCEPGAYWVWSDFVSPKKAYHRFLMQLMIWFFKASTNLDTDRVYDIYPVFAGRKWKCLDKAPYFDGFMETALFQKQP